MFFVDCMLRFGRFRGLSDLTGFSHDSMLTVMCGFNYSMSSALLLLKLSPHPFSAVLISLIKLSPTFSSFFLSVTGISTSSFKLTLTLGFGWPYLPLYSLVSEKASRSDESVCSSEAFERSLMIWSESSFTLFSVIS